MKPLNSTNIPACTPVSALDRPSVPRGAGPYIAELIRHVELSCQGEGPLIGVGRRFEQRAGRDVQGFGKIDEALIEKPPFAVFDVD